MRGISIRPVAVGAAIALAASATGAAASASSSVHGVRSAGFVGQGPAGGLLGGGPGAFGVGANGTGLRAGFGRGGGAFGPGGGLGLGRGGVGMAGADGRRPADAGLLAADILTPAATFLGIAPRSSSPIWRGEGRGRRRPLRRARRQPISSPRS